MSPPGSCPEPATLQRLLIQMLAPGEEAALGAHLQDCGRCQELLQGLAAGHDSWEEASVCLSSDSAVLPTEPSLVRVIERLEGRAGDDSSSANQEDPLDFLEPGSRPGCLGKLEDYEVVSVVGRGGMGIVLKAVDTVLQRVVAVKAMAPSLASSAEARKRFLSEARAAAAVAHDHVVTIHAVAEKAKVPFLVMQFVSGMSLEEKIKRTGPLPVEEILRIGLQIGAGLAAAHAQGLIHRDIKPANILLENGVQRVKITDFGLARMKEDAGVTQSGVIAGTPQFMAPEQARGEHLDHRADLFSLGSVLYAMCTGQSPFRGGTYLAVLRRIIDEEPQPIREINPALPQELIDVVAKLHRKDPAQRYQSAAEVSQVLAALLARLQSHGTLQGAASPQPLPGFAPAPPPWPTRRRVLLAGLGTALVVVAGAVYFGMGGSAEKQPESQGKPPGAGRPIPPPILCSGHTGEVYEVACSPDKVTAASAGEDKTIRLWNIRTGAQRPPLEGHDKPIRALAFSPDGEILASGSDDGEVRLWTVATGGQLKRLKAHTGRVYSVAFSPDGATLASAGEDRKIHLWEWQTGRERFWNDDDNTIFVRRLAFSPDGKVLVSAGQQLNFWDVKTGSRVRSLGCVNTSALRFDADGRFVAAADWTAGAVALFDPADGKTLGAWQAHDANIENLVIAKARDLLVTVGDDGVVRAWDTRRQRLRAKWPAHPGVIYGVALAPDGATLVTGGCNDHLVKIWDLAELPEAAEPSQSEAPASEPLAVVPIRKILQGHTGAAQALAFAPDGNTLASAGYDKTVRLWDTETGAARQELRGHQHLIQTLAFSPDGMTLASGGGDKDAGEILLWDPKTGNQVGSLGGIGQTVMDVVFSPDSKSLACCGFEKVLRLFNVAERKEIATLESKQPVIARRVLFTKDAQTLLTCGDLLSLYDVPSAAHKLDVPHAETSDMKLSPRGDLLAAAAWTAGKITLFDWDTLKPRVTWQAHRGELQALAFSPDGRFLASTSNDGTAKIWDVADQRLRAVLIGHFRPLYAVVFAPDGQTLATTGTDRDTSVILWDVSALKIQREP